MRRRRGFWLALAQYAGAIASILVGARFAAAIVDRLGVTHWRVEMFFEFDAWLEAHPNATVRESADWVKAHRPPSAPRCRNRV